MMERRVQRRAVERAAEITEGIEALALYLGVPPPIVAAWIEGTSEVPPGTFLKVVEILVDFGGLGMRGIIPCSLVERFKHRQAANG